MKQNHILKISVLPLILFTVIAFTNVQPEKKDQNSKGNNAKNQPVSRGNNANPQEKKVNTSKGNDRQGNSNQKQKNQAPGKSAEQGKNNSGNKSNGNNHTNNNNHSSAGQGNKSNVNSNMMNGKRDMIINWNLDNFADRKHPRNQKKVKVCHNPSGNGENGVNISISENALQAHLNHGDKMGDCNINYSDRWSSNYVKSRENVYNTYESAWETMSYSEAILSLAMQKLLGIRTNFDRDRSTLSSADIERREMLIMDLQNNVNSLQNQLNSSRQTLDSDVNIIIRL
ncbi:hypothetical protein [Daejeonella oryzae]|uniref:hypothetical protein n=1 Tax=Daejeonella oryzae TaxID=1122943 RepID=UPI00040DD544|nr:hypothetical protein [Daejeonella oryzae]